MTSETKQRVDRLKDIVKVLIAYCNEQDLYFLNRLFDCGKEAKELIKEIDFNE